MNEKNNRAKCKKTRIFEIQIFLYLKKTPIFKKGKKNNQYISVV